uniref:Transmembrane protein n=1 Tax=Panagrellus redivivus TaxID=6233 RepID=A0A7E4UQ21_PANRE
MVLTSYNMKPQKLPLPAPMQSGYPQLRLSIAKEYTWLCGLIQPRDVIITFHVIVITFALYFGLTCGADIDSTCSPGVVSLMSILKDAPSTTPNTALMFFSWYLILSSLIALFGLRILEHESDYGYHAECGLRPCIHPFFFFFPAFVAQLFLFVLSMMWIVNRAIFKFHQYNHDEATVFTYAFYILHVILPLLTFTFWIVYVFYGVTRAIVFFLVARNEDVSTPYPLLLTNQQSNVRSASARKPAGYSPL